MITKDKYPNQGKFEEGICDSCGQEEYDLIECPSAWYESDHGTIDKKFCPSCCEDVFSSEGCLTDVENCERADELMKKKLSKYAEEKEFTQMNGIENVFISKHNLFAMGFMLIDPHEALKGTKISEYSYYRSKDNTIIKTDEGRASFSHYIIDKIKEHIEELRSEIWDYGLIKKNDDYMYVIFAAGVWFIVPRYKDQYESERDTFIRDLKENAKFFEIEKDDLVLVDKSRLVIDWSKLDDKQFVELCRDLYETLSNNIEATITEGSGDKGRDIKATEKINTIFGDLEIIWCIQCKHHSSPVYPSQFGEVVKHLDEIKFDRYCLMTSNFLSPGSHDMIDGWNTGRTYKFKATYRDKSKIEYLLKMNPEIFAKYFT